MHMQLLPAEYIILIHQHLCYRRHLLLLAQLRSCLPACVRLRSLSLSLSRPVVGEAAVVTMAVGAGCFASLGFALHGRYPLSRFVTVRSCSGAKNEAIAPPPSVVVT